MSDPKIVLQFVPPPLDINRDLHALIKELIKENQRIRLGAEQLYQENDDLRRLLRQRQTAAIRSFNPVWPGNPGEDR